MIIRWLILSLFFIVATNVNSYAKGDFTLNILHTNDAKSNYGGFHDNGSTCYEAICQDKGSKGGMVRLSRAVAAMRNKNPDAILLDAGGSFEGSLYFTMNREKMINYFLDALKYDAATFGNYEFSNSCETLNDYVKNSKTPLVAANLSFSYGQQNVPAFTIIERQGRKIGIIGITGYGNIDKDNICQEAILNTNYNTDSIVSQLKKRGVDIIIALTHIGMNEERKLARRSKGIDVIIGGLNSELEEEEILSEYPIIEKGADGKPVVIASADSDLLSLGNLNVTFDKNGVVKSWEGRPLFLDDDHLDAIGAPPAEENIVNAMLAFSAPVHVRLETEIATIDGFGSFLESDIVQCQRDECITGNIVADAMLYAMPNADIALINGGAIKASLPVGKVTIEDVLSTTPTDDVLTYAKITGKQIIYSLEYGLMRYRERSGRVLIPANLRYEFNPGARAGSRISKAEIFKDGVWIKLNPKAEFVVVTSSFLASGGDNIRTFSELEWTHTRVLISTALTDYLVYEKNIKAEYDNRIDAK